MKVFRRICKTTPAPHSSLPPWLRRHEGAREGHPGNITYGGGSDGNPLGGNRKYCQLYIDPSNWNFPRQQAGSYPIVGVSYLLFYGNNNGVHVADKTTLSNTSHRRRRTRSSSHSNTLR